MGIFCSERSVNSGLGVRLSNAVTFIDKPQMFKGSFFINNKIKMCFLLKGYNLLFSLYLVGASDKSNNVWMYIHGLVRIKYYVLYNAEGHGDVTLRYNINVVKERRNVTTQTISILTTIVCRYMCRYDVIFMRWTITFSAWHFPIHGSLYFCYLHSS